MFWPGVYDYKDKDPVVPIKASQKRSSSSLSSDSVGSIMRVPVTGHDSVGAWKPVNNHGHMVGMFLYVRVMKNVTCMLIMSMITVTHFLRNNSSVDYITSEILASLKEHKH